MSKGTRFIQLGIIAALFLTQSTFAQNAKTKAKQSTLAKSKKEPRFSMGATLELNTNLEENASRESSQGAYIALAPSLKLSKSFTLSTLMELENELASNADVTINNIPIKVSYTGIKLSKNVSYTPSASMLLATNHVSKETDTLQTAVIFGQKLEISNVFNTKMSVKMGLSLKNSFHEYTRDADDQANVQFSATQSLGLSYSLTDKLSAGASFGYLYGRTYQGDEKFLYELAQSISYEFSDTFSAYVSHSNEGSAIDSFGTRDIKVHDPYNSTIAVGLDISI